MYQINLGADGLWRVVNKNNRFLFYNNKIKIS